MTDSVKVIYPKCPHVKQEEFDSQKSLIKKQEKKTKNKNNNNKKPIQS